MKRAGADRVISPHRIGGRHMAMMTLRPLLVDFIDTAMISRGEEYVLENIKVDVGSPAMGIKVKEALGCCGALAILALKKESGKIIVSPQEDILIELGDDLVVIGTRQQLRTLGGEVEGSPSK